MFIGLPPRIDSLSGISCHQRVGGGGGGGGGHWPSSKNRLAIRNFVSSTGGGGILTYKMDMYVPP